MSAQETVVAVAAGTGAAVVAKTINTNKLADTLSKTRKTRWFRWVDINVPNDFAEADAHQADPNIIANAPTLETLGKLVTVGKYSIVVIMALSLTVFYGIQYTVFVGDYKPSSFADYNKFRALQPGLRCSCGVQTSPFSNFASASVEMNPACEWVGPDLIGYAREVYCPDGGEDALGQCYDLSTCRSASNVPLCQATDESCKQSNETIEWILQEFRNTPVSSTELLAQDTLENLANQTFESAIKLGSLISTTPVKTVEAWASANVPNLASMAGRGQEALSFAQGIMDLLKNFTLIALRDGIFANATAAEKKMYEDGANYQWNDDYFPPFVDYGRESDQRGKIPVWQLSISPCDGIYWETNTWLQGETNRYSIEINQLIYPYDQTWWDDQWSWSRDAQWDGNAYVGGCPSIDQCCLDRYRKCLYDCIYNGETFTDWNGYYASIPSWVPYDEAQNTAGHSVYPHYTMPGLTCTQTYVGPLWRNEFEELTNGNFPLPPWITDEYDEYKFKKSGTSGCDPYSVALDTTYFAHDTPERYLLIKNASYDTAEKYLRDSAKAAGQPDPVFDNMGPGSRTDYVEKFAIPIMKRHGTVRNAISNLFIDEKVVSVNYEDYFNTCAITTCTYTYSAQLSTAALTSVIFGLIGGIVAFMNLFGGFVYDACKAAVLRGAEEATGRESSHEDETRREAPHEHETKGSDAPAVPKSRAWTGMFGSGAPAVPKARA